MLGYGLSVAAIGIGVVFTALVVLIAVIKIMSMLAEAVSGKKKQEPVKSVKAEPAKASAPAVIEDESEEEIIAVIAAAVACMSQNRLVVSAIRRVPGAQAPAWSFAGRQDTMNLRQW